MKKLFSVLLALALLLSLAACGKQPSAKPPADTEAPALPQESEPSPEPEQEPEPAPEPEPADPRALWTAAETASAAYDSYEMEFREDLTAV
ncbi:MAG: hypothetical protein IIU58_06725, partial [Clostridia bacterium]|nr:hypothetical protein [Clostridia bacterium]